MRGIKFFVLVVFVLFLIYSNLLFCLQENDRYNDNYGKVEGLIIDERTFKPVDEIFIVLIGDERVESPFELERFGAKTDKKGYFICKKKPGNYVLYFYPEKRTSKYCWDKNFMNYPDSKQIITVEKGKITKVLKKAKLAGKIKFILESTSGEKINPKERFGDKVECDVRIYAPILTNPIFGDMFSENGEDFNDGEITVYTLCPEIYSAKVDFDGMGYGSVEIKNIEVKKDSTKKVKVIINLNDSTGVEGYILDKNGNPIDGVEVSVGGPIGNMVKDASVFTDSNGYYKIVGLIEGIYRMIFSKQIGNTTFLRIRPRDVLIKKDAISLLDVKVNYNYK